MGHSNEAAAPGARHHLEGTVDHDPVEPNTLRGGVARPNTILPGTTDVPGRRRAGFGPDAARTADAAAPFGPNTGAVLELLRRLSAMGTIQAERLAHAWRVADEAAREAAHAAAQAAAESSGRRGAARAAQQEAARWINETAGPGHSWTTAEGSATVQYRDAMQSRRDAFPAVIDAVAAVVLAGVLDRQAEAVLLGPWSETVGPGPEPDCGPGPEPEPDWGPGPELPAVR